MRLVFKPTGDTQRRWIGLTKNCKIFEELSPIRGVDKSRELQVPGEFLSDDRRDLDTLPLVERIVALDR